MKTKMKVMMFYCICGCDSAAVIVSIPSCIPTPSGPAHRYPSRLPNIVIRKPLRVVLCCICSVSNIDCCLRLVHTR